MKQAGQIILFRFPQTDMAEGKLRPALLLVKLPGAYDDWLACMISTQTRHYLPEFDELIKEGDGDYAESGLKGESLIRVGRLAVLAEEFLLGAIGQVSAARVSRIKKRLAAWLVQEQAQDNDE